MAKLSRRIVLAGILMLFAAGSYAQQPGGGNPFAQMREKYKYTFQLTSMVRHIGDIDKDPKYKLTPAQAKKVLGVLQPLRSKPKMTQDQAKAALKALKPIFTVAQLNAMARIPASAGGRRQGGGMGMGGPGGPGGGRPGGPGGAPGGNRPGGPGGAAGRPAFDPNAMKDFNPFYAKAAPGDQFGARNAKRWDALFTGLQARAKGGKAPIAPASNFRGRSGAPAPKPAPKPAGKK